MFAAVACVLALLLGGGYYYYEYIHLPEERRRAQEAEIARQSAAEDEAKRQRDERISELMTGAASDLASDRLTSPVGNNAWEKYQAVLEMLPGHKEASAGLDSVIGRYVTKFDGSLRDKAFDKADEYMSRIRGVWVDAPVLSSLEERLSAARGGGADVVRRKPKKQDKLLRQAEKRRQEQRVSRTFRDCVECPEMVVVPSGSFTMGSPGNGVGTFADDEGPQSSL